MMIFKLYIVTQELDSQDPVHKEFWDAMMVIAEVELQEAVKQDEMDWARLRGEPLPAKYTIKEAGLHESVDSDVQMMLAGMSFCAAEPMHGLGFLPVLFYISLATTVASACFSFLFKKVCVTI